MMRCQSCGYTLPGDSEFCQYCGEKLAVVTEVVDQAKNAAESVSNTNGSKELSAKCAAKMPDENRSSPIQEKDISDHLSVIEPSIQTASETDADDPTQTANELEAKNRKLKFSRQCGGLIDAKNKRCASCGKEVFRSARDAIILSCLLLLVIALAGSNIYQYLNYRKQTESLSALVTDLERQIKTKDATITAQKSTSSSQKSEISEFEYKADRYDDIFGLMSSGNIGYAASNFRSSESVIVLSKMDTNRKFTLTAHWRNGGTVSVSYSSRAASVSFGDDPWTTSTTLTVKPAYEGVTVVTFKNDVNSKTFKILIIVTA